MKKSHTAELVMGAVLAVIITYIVLSLVVSVVFISEPICAAIIVAAVVTTECVLLRGYADEDKQEILEELRKQPKE